MTSDEYAAKAWREVGHTMTWLLFEDTRDGLNEALWAISRTLRANDPVIAEDIQQARMELDHTRWLLEDYLATLADGVEPWGDGVSSTATYGAMADQLETSRCGYIVIRPDEEPADIVDLAAVSGNAAADGGGES